MTARPLFSPSWYRVASLRPRLRAHAEIHRQRFRGETWYVLEDRARERFHRFSPAVYQVIGLMDGRRTVQELWDLACERLGDGAPTQNDLILLLSQLHATDMLQSERTPDTAELLERGLRHRHQQVKSQLLSVLSWRIPLLDPERLLQSMLPLARPLAGWAGAVLWMAVVGPAAVLAAMHWRDLTHGAADQLMAAQNLVAFWLLFMALKTLHELGHAVATRAYGGEVHDMGLMFLVFHPVPYVDASSAWKFPEKWRRITVGAAGMLVELFLAALAIYVWRAAEPGLVRTLAFDTIVIAGVSTVLFNANPLLRFDGYYMLSDWLEIPNLRARSTRYLGYLCERYLFGGAPERPRTARGEPAWFVGYAVASFLYRVMMVAILLVWLGQMHFYLAVIVGGLAAVLWVGVPVAKGIAYLFTSPRLRPVRMRAVAVTTAALVTLIALVGFVPVPDRSRAEGVIWVPEDALVRATVNGFVDRIVARPGQPVRRGQPLFTLRDATLVAGVAELEAQRRELLARHDGHAPTDRVKAQMVADELRYVERDLAEARRRVAELTVTAGIDGTFVVAVPEDLPGRFVKRGEPIGYVIELGAITVRVVVPQADIDLVRNRSQAVHVRLAERLYESVPGSIRRVVPGATEHLPAVALGALGGGTLAVDPRDERSARALERVFQVDVELRQRARHVNVGGRAFVRFDHGRAPLAQQWSRQRASSGRATLRQACATVLTRGVRHARPQSERRDHRPTVLDRWARRATRPVTRWLRARQVRPGALIRAVAEAEAGLPALDDRELRDEALALRGPLRQRGLRDDLIARSFALVREAAGRTIGQRHYDAQLIGGRVLLAGLVAEMETGEGKTLTATLAAGTAALGGTAVHVVTVNDYLAARDAEWMGPVYRALGLTVGVVVHGMTPEARRAAYRADVTYCTNKELAFDYLRDRLALGRGTSRLRLMLERLGNGEPRTRELVLRGLHFAIVDEADSVLVDEARTPLVIAGPGDAGAERRMYEQALGLAGRLEETDDFTIDARERTIDLTARGHLRLAELARPLGGPWHGRLRREHLVRQALAARNLYHRDTHYLRQADGRVVIVDEFTGRRMPDRAWEHDLHQLIETKEGVPLTPRNETLARISYQRFFRRYLHLAGMSGTAREAASELWSVYGLGVWRVPPRRPLRRRVLPARVCVTAEARWAEVVARTAQARQSGRPVLIGTRSVAASEHLSRMLHAAGLEHRVLNARQDEAEAEIVARAGEPHRITVATNMAGRGTDITLAPGVAERGGLHVIATEYHEARRIDRQLFGRCGRQGDPGSAEVIASLDDELIVRHGAWWRRLARWAAGGNGRVSSWMAGWMAGRAQRGAERLHARLRADLLRLDEHLETTLAFSGSQE